MRGGVQKAGVGTGAPLNTPQSPVDQRVIAAIPSQGPDYAGEGGEGIRTTDVLRAVRYLPRDHCPTERSLSTVVGRLDAWIIQETQAGCPGHGANRVRSAASSCPHPTWDGRGGDRSPLVSAARPRRQSPPPLLGDMPAGAPSLL